jgi:hypothetical protein
MKIAICVPSRGLIFSKTTECISDGIIALTKLGHEVKYFATHDLPIPDCHNECTIKAYEWRADRILYVEEDMYIPTDAFISLCITSEHMATLNYNDKNGRPHGIIEFNRNNEVVWCGLGATSVSRELLEKIDKPYFCTTRRWQRLTGPKGIYYEKVMFESPYQYGGQDVDFCMRVVKLGYKIKCLTECTARHLQLLELGKPHINQGMHSIREV